MLFKLKNSLAFALKLVGGNILKPVLKYIAKGAEINDKQIWIH